MSQELLYKGMTLLHPESGVLQEEVYKEALKALKSYFEASDTVKTKQLMTARIAMGVTSNYAKLQQTNRVKDATQLAVISLVTDRENIPQLQEYVKTALPHLNPIKQ